MDLEKTLRNLSMQEKIKYFSIIAGLTGLLLAILIYVFISSAVGAGLFLASLVFSFLPYGVYSYFDDKKYEEMERQWPSFLRNLSEAIKSGMSLPQAFQNAAQTDYGRLNEAIELSSKQLSWDIPFTEVMHRFQDRVTKSRLISNSISIIMQSYESGGDIAKTMDSVSRNLSSIQTAHKEKKATLMQQVYIIYAIYFLFVGIIIALYRILLPLLDIGGGGGDFIGGAINFCTDVGLVRPICNLCPMIGLVDATDQMCYYQALFFIMLIVQGIFSGLVAGEIGSGKMSAGIKHALIMVPAGVISYVVLLTVLGV